MRFWKELGVQASAVLVIGMLAIMAVSYGCDDANAETKWDEYYKGIAQRDVDNGIYVQDKRTGICYLGNGLDYAKVYTYVPCTDKVLEQIRGKAEAVPEPVR